MGWLITLQLSVRAVGFDNRCWVVQCFVFFNSFQACSENILQQLKRKIYLKLKLAQPS